MSLINSACKSESTKRIWGPRKLQHHQYLRKQIFGLLDKNPFQFRVRAEMHVRRFTVQFPRGYAVCLYGDWSIVWPITAPVLLLNCNISKAQVLRFFVTDYI